VWALRTNGHCANPVHQFLPLIAYCDRPRSHWWAYSPEQERCVAAELIEHDYRHRRTRSGIHLDRSRSILLLPHHSRMNSITPKQFTFADQLHSVPALGSRPTAARFTTHWTNLPRPCVYFYSFDICTLEIENSEGKLAVSVQFSKVFSVLGYPPPSINTVKIWHDGQKSLEPKTHEKMQIVCKSFFTKDVQNVHNLHGRMPSWSQCSWPKGGGVAGMQTLQPAVSSVHEL